MVLCIALIFVSQGSSQTELLQRQASSETLETEPLTSANALNRGHAYLASNRLDEAKRAYLLLFATDRYSASVLMNAMRAWVEKRRSHSEDVDAAKLKAFDQWIRERADLAAKTINMSHNAPDWK
jgi:hypothetical protein